MHNKRIHPTAAKARRRVILEPISGARTVKSILRKGRVGVKRELSSKVTANRAAYRARDKLRFLAALCLKPSARHTQSSRSSARSRLNASAAYHLNEADIARCACDSASLRPLVSASAGPPASASSRGAAYLAPVRFLWRALAGG